MWRRRYVTAIIAGVAAFFAVYAIDAALAGVGMHAETTHIDDVLLGFLVAVLVYFLERHHDRELARQRHHAAVVEQMNHHIRNALQVISNQITLDLRKGAEIDPIRNAIDRVDWALREILPRSAADRPTFETGSRKGPAAASSSTDDAVSLRRTRR
jgi:hypothetical protein